IYYVLAVLYAHQFLYLLLYMYFAYLLFLFFFFNVTATTEIYTISLHDALPIYAIQTADFCIRLRHAHSDIWAIPFSVAHIASRRSEEHTSELQSPCNLVCRLLLEKKNKIPLKYHIYHTKVHL